MRPQKKMQEILLTYRFVVYCLRGIKKSVSVQRRRSVMCNRTKFPKYTMKREYTMKKNLIFIGMPAVGKSTVGIVVAKRLGMHFIDTDLLIQEQEHKLLREIIDDVGLEGFLKIEDQVNASVKAKNSVISPGGSVIYCENAMKHYKNIGTIVYLKASYQTIKKRIRNPKKRGVVLKEGQSLKDLYYERVPYFEKYADITVCEDGCRIEDTIKNVLNAVRKYKKRTESRKKLDNTVKRELKY